jgi:cyclophilin family peptidyl-prolyl cis-trans isomerase
MAVNLLEAIMRGIFLGLSLSLVSFAANAQDATPQSTPPPVAAAAANGPVATFETSAGSFTIQLDETHAPLTVKNFVRYAKEKHFDGTAFYRVVPGALVQAGSYDAKGKFVGGLHKPIPFEGANGVKNLRGSIAMARTDPDSATAEFFIDLADAPSLDHQPGDAANATGYAVFGRVASGMEVVDAIAKGANGGSGPFGAGETPAAPVVIQKVSISGA